MEFAAKTDKLKKLLYDIAQSVKTGKEDEVKKLLHESQIYLLGIKSDWRKLCLSTEAQRETSQKCKQEVDQTDLQLQNLLYIKRYYEGEIQGNLNFNSEFSDEDLGLLDPTEFQIQAPGEFKKDINDEHELMLQRLSHEQYMRKQLVSQGQNLKNNLKNMSTLLSKKRSEQEELKGLLNNVENSAKKLESSLNSTLTSDQNQNLSLNLSAVNDSRVQLLPLPMYIVYSQIYACAQMYDLNIQIQIHGDEEEGNAWIQKMIRVEQQSDDPIKESESRSKRHKSDSNHKQKKSKSEHPLYLSITFGKNHADSTFGTLGTSNSGTNNSNNNNNNTPLLVLYIFYIPVIRLMVAKCDHDEALSAIFPGDDGKKIPSEFAVHASIQNNNNSNNIKQIPDGTRPYKWLQDLGGIDFLPAMCLPQQFAGVQDQQKIFEGMQDYRQQKRALNVIQRLIQVRKGMMAFQEIVQFLDMKKIPPIQIDENYSDTNNYGCEVFSWVEVKQLTKQIKEVLQFNSRSENLLEEDGEIMLVDSNDKNDSETEKNNNTNNNSNQNNIQPTFLKAPYKLYTLVFRYKYAATIKLLVQVFIDYPLHAPQILVCECTKTGDGTRMLSKPQNVMQQYQIQIKAMEEEVNLTALESVPQGCESQVFAYQLHHVVRCFDMLVHMILEGDYNAVMSLSLKQKLRGRAKFLKL